MAEKYSIEQKTVENILGFVRNGEIGKNREEVKRLNFKVGNGTAYVCGSMSNGLIQKSQFPSQGINFEVSTPAPYYIFEIE